MVVLNAERGGHLVNRPDEHSFRHVTTADNQTLDAHVYVPRETSPRAVLICAHAMMADMNTFAKSGFARHMVDNDFAVVLFNFRGRGTSHLDDWSYDELVEFDVPADE